MSPGMRGEPRDFRNEIVRVADHTVNTSEMRNYTFSNCQIVGPAILLPIGNTSIIECGWDVPDLNTLFWEIPESRPTVVGAVAAIDCTFSGCRFVGIGLAGPRSLRDVLQEGFETS